MQFDKRNRELNAGFATIQTYDPALYARMVASPWYISTDCEDAFWQNPYWAVARECQRVKRYAYGSTDDGTNPPATFINAPDIASGAVQFAIPSAYFMATILAHEFVHIDQHAPESLQVEVPAYRAAVEFARKLPEPYGSTLVELEEKTLVRLAMMSQ